MKKYVLTIAETFPTYHIMKGEPTNFPLSIKYYDKIHTIRGNYDLWKKRFEKIDKGEAYLSVRIWDGKPYYSKQSEIFRFDKTHDIGIEKLIFSEKIMTPFIPIRKKNGSIFTPDISTTDILAKNDGLELSDFQEWFKPYDFSKPMAIIHFTGFRYGKIRKGNS